MVNDKPIAIIGVGNTLMGDEGVGGHAISYLGQFDWPEWVELIDAGVPGPALLHMIGGRRLSIIIDCGDFQGKPGDVLSIPPDRLKTPDESSLSLHETSLLGTLALAREANIKIGDVITICIQPKAVKPTLDLSDDVSNALPKIKEEIIRILDISNAV